MTKKKVLIIVIIVLAVGLLAPYLWENYGHYQALKGMEREIQEWEEVEKENRDG